MDKIKAVTEGILDDHVDDHVDEEIQKCFSKEDPKLKKNLDSPDIELLDNTICHNKVNDTYVSFFAKDEILELFKGFKTLYISQEYSLEQNHDEPHYAGIIKYIGMKIKPFDK